MTSKSASETKFVDTKKITALWAFSESAFGGILHALRIPLTGLFVGSAAVFFISLIAQKSKSEILKSTFLVILVKVVVTPFVQLTSHFAVLVQGIVGFIFFKFIPFRRVAIFIFAVIALLLSAFQKIIILTILFGSGLWIAIDSFMKFLIIQFSLPNEFAYYSFSWILIVSYTLLHILAGIFVSIKILNFEHWIKSKNKELNLDLFSFNDDSDYFKKKNGIKKKRWWQKKSGITILTFSFIVLIISYLYPNLGENLFYDILFMLVRSFVITFVWFAIIAPKLVSFIQRFFEQQKFQHASEINSITAVFPDFKRILNFTWNDSKKFTGFFRAKYFLSNTIALLFLINKSYE